jgi:glycogen debranching enzyme
LFLAMFFFLIPVPRLPNNFSKPIHINLPISHAGAFVYWVEYDGPTSERIVGRQGYFNIDPILRVKGRSHILCASEKPLPAPHGGKVLEREATIPLDGLVVLTVVSKWMGPIQEWTKHFQEAAQRGYNMLHYTPLQQRGSSGSPYSIADQLSFDRQLVGSRVGSDVSQLVKEVLRIARDDHGLLSMTDVVLNHTAHNSSWLLEHPEAGSHFLSRIRTTLKHIIF